PNVSNDPFGLTVGGRNDPHLPSGLLIPAMHQRGVLCGGSGSLPGAGPEHACALQKRSPASEGGGRGARRRLSPGLTSLSRLRLDGRELLRRRGRLLAGYNERGVTRRRWPMIERLEMPDAVPANRRLTAGTRSTPGLRIGARRDRRPVD